MSLRRSFKATNLVQNGNFAKDSNADGLADGWTATSVVEKSIVDGTQKFTSGAQWGSLRANVALVNNHKYYGVGIIKATSNLVRIVLTGDITAAPTSHTGSGNFERLSVIGTPTTDTVWEIAVVDYRSSAWTEIQIMQFLAIDITALFGAGNEPTKSQCDVMFSTWFDKSMASGSMSRSFR